MPGIPLSSSMDWLQAILGLIVLSDLSLLAAERRRLCIKIIAMQGILLGILPLIIHRGEAGPYMWAVAAIFCAIKGVLLPWLLRRTLRRLPPLAPMQPYVGSSICVLLGVCGFILSLWLGARLELTYNPLFPRVFPMAFTTIFAGLLLIVAHKTAMAQIFGYLVLENGIYLLGAPMAQGETLWLELTILLDILVGVFVMGVAILHLYRAFESTDVDRFAALRD